MDRVTFGDGVSYEKASVIARRFKYTADYVGQLCRGRKVDARLVGRTWYVNPDSLEKYQSKKKRPDDKTLFNKTILVESRLNVEPVIGKNTSRSLRFSAHQAVASNTPSHYMPDGNDLYPRLTRAMDPVPVAVPVTMSGERGIRVHTSSKVTKFKASELPEVSLRGKIKVQSVLPEVETKSAPQPEVVKEVKESQRQKPHVLNASAETPAVSLSHKADQPLPESRSSIDVLRPSHTAPLSTPSPLRLMAIPQALLLAGVTMIVLVGATLFVSAEYFVSPTDASSSFSFDTTQFTALVALISYTH